MESAEPPDIDHTICVTNFGEVIVLAEPVVRFLYTDQGRFRLEEAPRDELEKALIDAYREIARLRS